MKTGVCCWCGDDAEVGWTGDKNVDYKKGECAKNPEENPPNPARGHCGCWYEAPTLFDPINDATPRANPLEEN